MEKEERHPGKKERNEPAMEAGTHVGIGGSRCPAQTRAGLSGRVAGEHAGNGSISIPLAQ